MRFRNDRSIAIVLVLLLAAGLWALHPASNDLGPPYQLSGRGPDGLSGLGAGLQEAGIDVHSRILPTLPGDGLSVIVEPSDVSHDDAAAWMGSLRDGATMVYAGDYPNPFTQALGVRYVDGGGVLALPAATAFPAATVPPATFRAAHVPRSARRLYQAGPDGAALAVIPVGRGAVWFFTDPSWITNRRVIATALPIVLPLASAAGGSASFDRYHHSGAGHLERARLPAAGGHPAGDRGRARRPAAGGGAAAPARAGVARHRRRSRR